jgi:tRNA dimethylallyltransferase
VSPVAAPLVVIAGPTATGKTTLSIRLAEALRDDGIEAEIISADSRQVYRGLDIGTAKVTAAEQARVPHHGLDLVAPDQSFSVADYLDHVRPVLAALAARGALAILVGGTGFYIRAVAGGLDSDALPSDPGVRAAIEAELEAGGLAAAARHLQVLAPGLAARTDLRNPRRVARALEIATIAGDVALPTPNPYPGPLAWLGLQLEPAAHRLAIERRASAQFEAGLLAEAASLRERFDPNLPAFSAIGYREAWAYLDGELDLEGAIALDASRNVAFARRQRTWFRSENQIEWLDESAAPEQALEVTLARARSLAERAGIVRR